MRRAAATTLRRTAAAVLGASVLAGGLVPAAAVSASGGDKVDFNRDVKPILSDRCFTCHGPDESKRQAKLRLDTREGATAARKKGAAISLSAPEMSELLRRVSSTDPDEVMPPRDSGRKPLSPAERGVIARWIRAGAPYAPHWSFVPPERADAPASGGAIDAYLDARLRAEKLEPNPEADRATLTRRLALDLTGLPPTPEETAAFERDSGADAYSRLVDHYLSSPRFGERMAADWLDLARYSDTYGYQADAHRRVWPYRDWVIDAFNKNIPYDRFLTLQLAGDLVPGATEADALPTAFLRLHRQTNEGGSTEEEFRVEYVADRVQTFGTAFLGLTLECARCHDHKFDPIPQADYYGLFAFFQNIDESGLYSHFTDATPTPALDLPDAAQAARLAAANAAAAAARTAFDQEKHHAAARASDAVKAMRASGAAVPIPGAAGCYKFETTEKGAVRNAADPGKPGAVPESASLVDAPHGKAIRFGGDEGATFPGVGEWNVYNPFSVALWIRTPEKKDRAVVWKRSRAWYDAGSQGYELVFDGGRLRFSMIHFWPGDAASVRAVAETPPNTWVHVTATYDGLGRASGMKLFVDGAPAAVEVVRDGLTRGVAGGDPGPFTIGERFRDVGFKGGDAAELYLFNRAITPLEAAALAAHAASVDPRTAPDALLTEFYCEALDAETAKSKAALVAARRAVLEAADAVPQIMVMRELSAPKSCFILQRGRYDAPDHQHPVVAHTPAALPPMDPDLPRNRYGLARWLTSGRHPLAARVEVNRLWQMCFGRGLVATPENFGSQGEAPLHRELLDALAVQFVESGWDVRGMLKTIVSSAAYRASAVVRPDSAARDPIVALYSRFPARRLGAEQIRDQALYASGLLVEKLGGESVKPWQPPGLWEIGWGGTYTPDRGEGAHRRSLYTYWRRTVPPPNMILFDASKRDVCTARRASTSTPLQSLVLFNDPQFVEAAHALAARIAAGAAADERARVAEAFRRLAVREPSAAESEALLQLLHAERAAPGATDESALASVCSTILASDAAVVLR